MQTEPQVLLVEPSDTIAVPVSALLEQNVLTVERVTSIDDAKGRDLSSYAVLVVDVRLDDREGVSFVEWLHRTHSHLVGRVVVISAHAESEVVTALEALGVCGIVPKPVDAQEIVRAVLDCLEPSPRYGVQ